VSTTPATQAAKKATPTIPIVMIGLGDPVGTGLVDSLAQPGGNVTGMSMMVPEVGTKRLELLKEAVPAISRVLVLSYLADPIAPLQVKAMQQAAGSLGVTLQIHNIQTADDLPAAFEAGAKERADPRRSRARPRRNIRFKSPTSKPNQVTLIRYPVSAARRLPYLPLTSGDHHGRAHALASHRSAFGDWLVEAADREV
jgi:ABC transporter substrate binding protein